MAQPYLEVRGVSFRAFHGLWPEEQAGGQRFVADVLLYGRFGARAEASDELEGTVDYSRVCARVVEVAAERRVNLIEHLAARIAEAVLAEFPVAGVVIELVKVPPPAVVGSPQHVRVRVARGDLSGPVA